MYKNNLKDTITIIRKSRKDEAHPFSRSSTQSPKSFKSPAGSNISTDLTNSGNVPRAHSMPPPRDTKPQFGRINNAENPPATGPSYNGLNPAWAPPFSSMCQEMFQEMRNVPPGNRAAAHGMSTGREQPFDYSKLSENQNVLPDGVYPSDYCKGPRFYPAQNPANTSVPAFPFNFWPFQFPQTQQGAMFGMTSNFKPPMQYYQMPPNQQGASTIHDTSEDDYGHEYFEPPQNHEEPTPSCTFKAPPKNDYNSLSQKHQEPGPSNTSNAPQKKDSDLSVPLQKESSPAPDKDESAEAFGSLLAAHLKKLSGADRVRAEKQLFDCLDNVRSQCAGISDDKQMTDAQESETCNIKQEPAEIIELDSSLSPSSAKDDDSESSSSSSSPGPPPLEQQPWPEEHMEPEQHEVPLNPFVLPHVPPQNFGQQIPMQQSPPHSPPQFIYPPFFPEDMPDTIVTDINLSLLQLKQAMGRLTPGVWSPSMGQAPQPVLRPQGPFTTAPSSLTLRPGFTPVYDSIGHLYHTNGIRIIPGDFDAREFVFL